MRVSKRPAGKKNRQFAAIFVLLHTVSVLLFAWDSPPIGGAAGLAWAVWGYIDFPLGLPCPCGKRADGGDFLGRVRCLGRLGGLVVPGQPLVRGLFCRLRVQLDRR